MRLSRERTSKIVFINEVGAIKLSQMRKNYAPCFNRIDFVVILSYTELSCCETLYNFQF